MPSWPCLFVFTCVCVVFFIVIVYAFAHNPMSECVRDHVCVSLRFVGICLLRVFVCLYTIDVYVGFCALCGLL